MRRHGNGPSAEWSTTRVSALGIRRGLFGLACLCVLGFTASIGSGTSAIAAGTCPNEVFRTGPSAKLPDCRAFELVTPQILGGRVPIPSPLLIAFALDGDQFASAPNSVDGNGYLFATQSTAPGFGGTPFITEYHARRGASGWQTELAGPTGEQAANMWTGGHTPDQSYAFMRVPTPGGNYAGTLGIPGKGATYVRYPDGSFSPLGVGTVPADPDTDGIDNGTLDDPAVDGRYISPDGSHLIFESSASSAVPLLPNTFPSGTRAVYDRTPEGLKLISILPGETMPEKSSFFNGVSADGSVVLFNSDNTLYARVDNEYTVEVGYSSAMFVGLPLHCTAGPADAATKTFQWLRNGVPIPGATDSTYVTQVADEGKVVQCQVFALNANAGSTATASETLIYGNHAALVPVTIPPRGGLGAGPPPASATLTVGDPGGQTLTCPPSFWQGSPSFSYQWYRNGVALAGNGADTDTYTVQEADLATPAVFQCALTATNAGGSVTSISANGATEPPPSAPDAPQATASRTGAYLPNVITPAGVAADGSKVLYAQEGYVFSVDTATGDRTLLIDSGDAQVVNASDDRSHIFFYSRSQLDGSQGVVGQPNVYVWTQAGGTQFIATIADSDLVASSGLPQTLSFDNWTAKPGTGGSGVVSGPSERGVRASRIMSHRVTPDGSVFVFQTTAQVTPYDNNGKPEVYRYEVASDALTCVSCDPSGDPPVNGAQVVLISGDENKVGPWTIIENLSEDGETVFFETRDGLLDSDFDGLRDVYEWHDGTLSLIGSGNSVAGEELLGVTPDASTVFLRSRDQLLAGLADPGASAIFAARVNGGFPPDESLVTEPCVGDACQGAPSGGPSTPGAASSELSGQGNLKAGSDCSSASARAKKLSARAKRLQAQARNAGDRRAKRLRHQAATLLEKEKKLHKSAKRCRNSSRRASR